MYIIVWRATHRNSFVTDDCGSFLEQYSTYEEAKEAAKEMEGKTRKEPHWFDWKIYEEANN